MNLGLNLSLGSYPVVVGGSSSLYDTSDFTAGGPAAYREILGPQSFRIARDGGGEGSFFITGVPSGSYRITGTAADYDGAISVAFLRLSIQDNFTQQVLINSAGVVDETVSITSGTLRFRTVNDAGALFSAFEINAA